MPSISVYDAVAQSSALKPAETALLAECVSKAHRMIMQAMPEIAVDVERNALVDYSFAVTFKVNRTRVPGVNRVAVKVVYTPHKIKASCIGEVEDPAQERLKLEVKG